MDPGRVGRPMLRNLMALGASRVGVTAIQFLAFALLAAYLGPRALGVYTFALAFATLFVGFPNFGFRSVATRDIAQGTLDEAVVIPNLVYLRVLIGVVTYGALIAVVRFGGFRPDEARAAAISGLVIVIGAMDSFQTVLQVRLKLGWVSIADVVEAVVFASGAAALAWGHAQVDAFIWLYVGANTLNSLIVVGSALRLRGFRWRMRLRSCMPILGPAVPLGLTGLFIGLYYRMDLTILARTHSAYAVGQYGVGYRFLDAMNVVPGLLMAVLNPVLARSMVSQRKALERRYTVLVHLVTLGAILVSVVGAMTAARTLTRLPGFASYHGAGVALAVLAPAGGLILINTALSGVLVNGHLQRRLLTISAVTLVVNFALNIALIPPFSYVGASVATVLAEVAVTAGSLGMIRRHLDLHLAARRVRQEVVVAVVLALALVPGYLLHPFAQIAIGVVAFVAAAVGVGALAWSDLGSVLSGGGTTTVVVTRGVDPDGSAARVAASAPGVESVLVLRPTSNGAHMEQAAQPSARRVTADQGLLAVRRALAGAGCCTVVANHPMAGAIACLAARLAACREVNVVVAGPPGMASWSRLVRRSVRLLADSVVGGG